MTIEERKNRAAELFTAGYNCSQAVFAAFCDVTGYEEKAALRLASSFGGGMGRLREVCGAVSGLFMVAGLKYGYSSPEAKEEKTEHYRKIQELAAEFSKNNGSIICRELLGLQEGKDSHVPEARTEKYYKARPCVELVGDAAAILEEYIKNHN